MVKFLERVIKENIKHEKHEISEKIRKSFKILNPFNCFIFSKNNQSIAKIEEMSRREYDIDI